jgi:putative colanic acid biosynthesis UDP-glucose lipid carrier transferase
MTNPHSIPPRHLSGAHAANAAALTEQSGAAMVATTLDSGQTGVVVPGAGPGGGFASANDRTGVGDPPRIRGAASPVGVIESYLEFLVTLVWLRGLCLWLGDATDGRWPAALVLAFVCTFPGKIALGDRFTVVAGKSTATTVMVGCGLAVLGLASGWNDLLARHDVLWGLAVLPVMLVASHVIARRTLLPMLRRMSAPIKVVVVGGNAIGARLAAQFQADAGGRVQFLGFFDDRPRARLAVQDHQHVLGTFKELGNYVRKHGIDRIYLALPMATQPRVLELLEDLQDTTASVFFVPDIYVTDIINGSLASVDGIPVLSVRDTPFDGAESLLKRASDIVLAGAALILLGPVLAAIALGVRMSSPGPALFLQRRYGLDGREILVYKFRTMKVVEDGAGTFTAAIKGDPRITKFGQVLRKTSLDELPQLINVLQGRMSLVGPRPHAVAMNETFRKLIRGYMVRHKVKPGITGLAQVRGQRGGDDLEAMTARIASDTEYLRNWTLALDLWIIVRTAAMVVFDRKAY